jgi:trehalose-phosphatase
LLLDLDGTLAPIAPTPGEARVPQTTLDSLRRLAAADWRVAIISGRGRDDARRLVPLHGVRIFGSHGLEGSWPGRAPVRITPAVRRRLRTLTREAEQLAEPWRGVLVENKPAGLAIHDRGVAASRLGAWRRQLGGWLRTRDLAGLETIRGRRVVELRPAGVHKGLVLRALGPGGAGTRIDESLVGCGDDRTDEDLFRELEGLGLSILIGRARLTAARERLPSPAALARFLRRLSRP